LNLRDDQRAEIVGWSNLTKIGFCTGDNQNPTAAVVGEQAALCVRSLHEEIMQFRPTATVLLTGDWSAKKILEPCFGPGEEWQNNVPSENRVAVKLHETCGPLLWTYHPRWMRTQKDLEVATTSFISGYIAGLVTGSRMTQIE
jgi:hypothetical protein